MIPHLSSLSLTRQLNTHSLEPKTCFLYKIYGYVIITQKNKVNSTSVLQAISTSITSPMFTFQFIHVILVLHAGQDYMLSFNASILCISQQLSLSFHKQPVKRRHSCLPLWPVFPGSSSKMINVGKLIPLPKDGKLITMPIYA